MPLMRRIPKFGFKNRNRVAYKPVNLTRLNQLIEAGSVDPAEPITPEVLMAAGVAKQGDLIKVLGVGEAGAAWNVSAHAFSNAARDKIEAAGGSVTVA
jgi:large subunit ribosomal protein L15